MAITDDVIEQFLRRPPKFVVADDLSWIDEMILDVTKKKVDSRTLLSDRLVDHYSMIRAYHACCPTDLHSYRRDGVRLLNIETAHNFAREFFCGMAEIAVDDVEAAIRKQDASLRENRIWFGLDDRMLTQCCGHYLLYGSEYIVAIAAELTRTSKNCID